MIINLGLIESRDGYYRYRFEFKGSTYTGSSTLYSAVMDKVQRDILTINRKRIMQKKYEKFYESP